MILLMTSKIYIKHELLVSRSSPLAEWIQICLFNETSLNKSLSTSILYYNLFHLLHFFAYGGKLKLDIALRPYLMVSFLYLVWKGKYTIGEKKCQQMFSKIVILYNR